MFGLSIISSILTRTLRISGKSFQWNLLQHKQQNGGDEFNNFQLYYPCCVLFTIKGLLLRQNKTVLSRKCIIPVVGVKLGNVMQSNTTISMKVYLMATLDMYMFRPVLAIFNLKMTSTGRNMQLFIIQSLNTPHVTQLCLTAYHFPKLSYVLIFI